MILLYMEKNFLY